MDTAKVLHTVGALLALVGVTNFVGAILLLVDNEAPPFVALAIGIPGALLLVASYLLIKISKYFPHGHVL